MKMKCSIQFVAVLFLNVCFGREMVFKMPLKPKLSVGHLINVGAYISQKTGIYDINLCKDADQRTTEFGSHLNVCPLHIRLSAPGLSSGENLGIDALVNYKWGPSEFYNIGYKPGSFVEVSILVTSTGFEIAVNKTHRAHFKKRIEPSEANYLLLNGAGVDPTHATQHVVYPKYLGPPDECIVNNKK